MRRILGRIGVWLCDHCYSRPLTRCESASTIQYCQLMVDSLKGEIRWYGRDRTTDRVIVNEAPIFVGARRAL